MGYKIKTKKAAAKRFHTRADGTFVRGAGEMRHNLRRKHKDAKRAGGKFIEVSTSCVKAVSRYLPYRF